MFWILTPKISIKWTEIKNWAAPVNVNTYLDRLAHLFTTLPDQKLDYHRPSTSQKHRISEHKNASLLLMCLKSPRWEDSDLQQNQVGITTPYKKQSYKKH